MDCLRKRMGELQSDWDPTKGTKKPILSFDKDDEDTLDFVTAAANLRSAAFHIELQTKFDTKRELIQADMLKSTQVIIADIVPEMAGNIIPAIATTNAMTAGLCVLQAFKILQHDLTQAKMVIASKTFRYAS